MMDTNEMKRVIRECLAEVNSFVPTWNTKDMYYSACGAALKYAESQGEKISDELIAQIQRTVRQEMHGETV